jgi:hypothetical protein
MSGNNSFESMQGYLSTPLFHDIIFHCHVTAIHRRKNAVGRKTRLFLKINISIMYLSGINPSKCPFQILCPSIFYLNGGISKWSHIR